VKVALVSSVGGHLTELLALRSSYAEFAHFFVVNDATPFVPPVGRKLYTVVHAERDLGVLTNVWEFLKIFRAERPNVMLSTGAGPAVSAAVAARLLGMRVVFVESVAAVQRPTLTGILMQGLAHRYFVQWPELSNTVEGSEYCGNVFGSL
jgi:beta-1,4-N-acetylglucosaminyltransferase